MPDAVNSRFAKDDEFVWQAIVNGELQVLKSFAATDFDYNTFRHDGVAPRKKRRC